MEGPGQEAYEEGMRRTLDPEGYEDPGLKSSQLSLGEMSRASAAIGSPLQAWRARAEEMKPLRQYLPGRRGFYDLDGKRRSAGAPPGHPSRGKGQRE